MKDEISRRDLLTTIGAVAGVAAFAPRTASAQAAQAAQAPAPAAARVDPPTVISQRAAPG